MLGLKQAATLAYQHLRNCLQPFSYKPIAITVRLWYYKTRLTIFCLCVDNFGIKYQSKNDANHLCNAIRVNFRYTVDKEGKNYCGLTLDQNYKLEYVDISMLKSIPDILKKLNYILKIHLQHSPYNYTPIQYSIKGSH